MNNLYMYSSHVVLTGNKKFYIGDPADGDQDKYVMVISAALRLKFIEKQIFDDSEAYKVLRRVQLICLGMRKPDLEYLVLYDFDEIKKRNFFRCQEHLFGKTVMDICLSDPESVKDALLTYE